MRSSWFLVGVLLVPVLAGCIGPGDPMPRDCDAWNLVHDGVAYFTTRTHGEGGIVARVGAEPDPELTAWVLIATGVAKRTGQEGFDGRDHRDWLQDRLQEIVFEGDGTGSVPDELSLTRAALQAWGTMGAGVPFEDPDHEQVRSLADAWDVRFDEATGRYGDRLQEHLLGGFAARIFEYNLTRLQKMAAALDGTENPSSGEDPYHGDTWSAGYARALLGPEPDNASLAGHLDRLLDQRQDATGGVYAAPDATGPDASSTAAALFAWQAAGRGLEDPQVALAVDHLCGLVRDDGAVPFAGDYHVAHVKTTAEVVIALSLFLEPVPWPEPMPEA